MINSLSIHIRRVVLSCLAPFASAMAQTPDAVNQYLHKMGLDDAQIASAAAGKAVARLIPSKNDRDVVSFGVIGVPVSAADYMKHALDPGRLIGAGSSRFTSSLTLPPPPMYATWCSTARSTATSSRVSRATAISRCRRRR